jgi:hypothetical protein
MEADFSIRTSSGNAWIQLCLNPLAGGIRGRRQSEVSIYQFHATI